MNKNNPVLRAEYSKEYQCFTNILSIYNIKHVPLVINKNSNYLENLNEWLQNRPIPKTRKNLKRLLARLNVFTTSELLNKACGLSLSDRYWLKEIRNKSY